MPSRMRVAIPGTGRALTLVLALACCTVLGPVISAAQAPPDSGSSAHRAAQAPAWLEGRLPQVFHQIAFLHLELWQWLVLIVLVVIASALAYLAAGLLVRVTRTLVRRTRTTLDDELLSAVAGPLRMGLSVLLFYLGAPLAAPGEAARNMIDVGCTILSITAVTWLALRLVDVLSTHFKTSFTRLDPAAASTIVPMGQRLTKVFIVIVAMLSLLQNLGFNIAGILAGLGVGGLAIALAAQKTVENFFGGVVVIADRPAKVGDTVRVGEHFGTVEDIGLRSSRIRTLDRTLVTIPNAEFSTARIENFGSRDHIRLYTVLQVGYDTSPDQMRYLLVEIRKMLYAHPMTLPDPCRVRFVNFGAHSLDLEVFVYTDTSDWNAFLAAREDIFLRIMDIVAASGAYFAYPSQTLYLGKDPGRDPEATSRAEATVKAWRERNEIPFPEFPEAVIKGLDDTIEYPPAGSAPAPSHT